MTNSGLSKQIFLSPPDCAELALTHGSLLAEKPATESEVFAAVASTFQRLRSTGDGKNPPLGPRRFPLATVIEHEQYLVHTYTDSILRAAFLRASKVGELIYADENIEKQRTQCALELMTHKTNAIFNVAAEIALATHVGKFPGLQDNNQFYDSLRNLKIHSLKGERQT